MGERSRKHPVDEGGGNGASEPRGRRLVALNFWELGRLPKRGIDQELAGRVLATELQKTIGKRADRAAKVIRAAGIDVTSHQLQTYFTGTATPRIASRIAIALQLPELKRLSEFPWKLLTPADLTLPDIERVCASSPGATFRLGSFGRKPRPRKKTRRLKTRWSQPAFFDPSLFRIAAPSDPAQFWQHIASYRAAEVLGHHESMNHHRWQAVVNLASIAKLPSVAANLHLLLRCMRQLTRRVDQLYIWFGVDWQIVKEELQVEPFGIYSQRSPFRDVFSGCADVDEVGRTAPLARKIHQR